MMEDEGARGGFIVAREKDCQGMMRAVSRMVFSGPVQDLPGEKRWEISSWA